jgi:hypothetical protein
VIGSAKPIGEVPEPRDEPPLAGARVPNVSLQAPGLVVLYRNHPVVASPLGLALPFSVAEVEVTAVTVVVATVGAPAGVVNGTTEPNEVPPALDAMAQT